MHIQSDTYGKVVDAGFDYLTATVTPKHPDWELFQQLGLQFCSEMENLGHDVKEKQTQGYDGYQVADTYYGKRQDSCIWKTSGTLSRNVAHFLAANEAAPKITRADLQLTFEPETGEVHDLGKLLGRLRKSLVGSATIKASKSATFYNTDVCTGFTLGDRSSQSYLRAYLAGLKHPDRYAPHAIRFEVEWKQERALQIFELYKKGRDDVTLSGGYVAGEFLKYGIKEPLCANLEACNLPPVGRSSGDEKTIT